MPIEWERLGPIRRRDLPNEQRKRLHGNRTIQEQLDAIAARGWERNEYRKAGREYPEKLDYSEDIELRQDKPRKKKRSTR